MAHFGPQDPPLRPPPGSGVHWGSVLLPHSGRGAALGAVALRVLLEHRPSWRPAPSSNPWLPHPPVPAPTHTDGRSLLTPSRDNYVVRAFMQARSDAQRATAAKLLRPIIAGASQRPGILESTNWAAMPLPELAGVTLSGCESDGAESGGW